MITLKARNTILNSNLVIVVLVIIYSFLRIFTNIKTIDILTDIVFIILSIILIWFAIGIYQLFQTDLNIRLLYVSAGIILSSITFIFPQTLLILIKNTIVIVEISITDLLKLLMISSFMLLAVSFTELKKLIDLYVKTQRTLFKGDYYLPIGYILYAIIIGISIFYPDDVLYVDGAIVPDFWALILLIELLKLAHIILIIFGFWRLRRSFYVLDRIAELLPHHRLKELENDSIKIEQMLSSEDLSALKALEKKTTTEYSPKQKVFCIKCGLEIPASSTNCPNCGSENVYL